MKTSWCADTLQKSIERMNSPVGVIHSENATHSAHIAEFLLMNDAVGIRSWWTALAKLSEGETTFLIVEDSLSDEFQTIITQLNDRASKVEVFDKRLSESVTVDLKNGSGKLLLIGHRSRVVNMPLPILDGETLLRDFFDTHKNFSDKNSKF